MWNLFWFLFGGVLGLLIGGLLGNVKRGDLFSQIYWMEEELRMWRGRFNKEKKKE